MLLPSVSLTSVPEDVTSLPPSSSLKRRGGRDEASPTKPSKKLKANLEALEAAKRVQTMLPAYEKAANELDKRGFDVSDLLGSLSAWNFAVLNAVSDIPWTPVSRKLLEERLLPPEGAAEGYKNVFEDANSIYAAFCDLQTKVLDALSSPSEFAKPSIWPTEQANCDRLLCLRPPERKGLPLSTLHEVFRMFRIRANASLPKQSYAADATLRAAAMLCKAMGKSFEDEAARSMKFDSCVREIFPSWKAFHPLKAASELHSRFPDQLLMLDEDIPGCLREDKWEPGQSGADVYLQVARDFDLAISDLREKAKNDPAVDVFLRHGAPMFLICLLGPILFVAGGFYDGSSVIVEPLGRACFMLEDETDQRPRELAQLLYALQQGVDELRSVPRIPPLAAFVPGVPRLYSTCKLFGQSATDALLTLHRPLPGNGLRHLLFCAFLSLLPSPISVVVKLINEDYGEQVHRTLAAHGFAPVLYGYSQVEGAPTAYVMEHLGSEWKSLFDFGHNSGPGAAAFKDVIWTTLTQILATMEKEGIVHGDLRSNNIMVQVNKENQLVLSEGAANLKVVDFDWAGKAGEVCYPARRNDQIKEIIWPARAGSLIEAGHDRQVVDSWWPTFLAA